MEERMGGRGVFAGGSAVVCLLALAAPAPGQCYQGTRQTTKGERQFFVNTLGALKAAMPTLPPGWRIVEETDVQGPRAICVGREKEPLSLEFSVRYERVGPPANGRSVQLASVRSGGDAPDTLRVEVIVNRERQVFDSRVEAVEALSAPLAFQRADAGRASIDVLLGDWSVFRSDDPADPLEAMAHFDTGLPYTTVQSLSIRMAGSVQSVALLRGHLDLSKLRALVHH
jgi:hypothetical protein